MDNLGKARKMRKSVSRNIVITGKSLNRKHQLNGIAMCWNTSQYLKPASSAEMAFNSELSSAFSTYGGLNAEISDMISSLLRIEICYSCILKSYCNPTEHLHRTMSVEKVLFHLPDIERSHVMRVAIVNSFLDIDPIHSREPPLLCSK